MVGKVKMEKNYIALSSDISSFSFFEGFLGLVFFFTKYMS